MPVKVLIIDRSIQKIILYLYPVLFLIFCIGTLFFSSDSFVSKETTPKWYTAIGISTFLFILYYIDYCRYSGQLIKKIFPYIIGIIFLSCGILSLQGILQYADVLSVQKGFRLIGNFDNPAGYSASLCTGFPTCFYFIHWSQKKWIKYSSITIACILVCAVALSESRTGIISILVVNIIWWINKLNKKKNFKYLIISTTVLILSVTGLYFLKKNSADGRILIWTCSWEMIKDKPLLGHGYGSFHANYMDYQADYFRQNPDSKYAILADNISSPFNEYLLLGIQYGVLGHALFLTILFFLCKTYRKRKTVEVQIAILILAAVGTFALFSYPLFYPFPLIMLLGSTFFLLGGLQVKPVLTGGIITTTCLVICIFTVRNCSSQLEWNKIAKSSLHQQTPETFDQYERLYPRLKNNRQFLYNYTAELNYAGQYEKSRKIGLICRRFWADYDLQLLLGDNYLNLHNYEQAEFFYRQASEMCPNRFVPLYKLVTIYSQTNREIQAWDLAEQLLNKEVKVPSGKIHSIKREMKKLLDCKTLKTDLPMEK